jgi:DMSO reductase anchor subunit
MHPAPSIILFTILSGFGFGVIAWVGFLQYFLLISSLEVIAFSILGGFFAVIGLISSTFHLANKKNAIKSFSQWRSSWLSREAVASVICLAFVFVNIVGVHFGRDNFPLAGLMASFLSVITVFTTSMIYAQLRSIPAWNTVLTPFIFLFGSVVGAAILLKPDYAFYGLALFLAIQILFWLYIDQSEKNMKTNISTALGFNQENSIRSFDKAHTNQNYLLNEMVYKIGRKHSKRLRYISVSFSILIPIIIMFFVRIDSYLAGALVSAIHLLGMYFSRWLFFAEAKHVVSFYYDES